MSATPMNGAHARGKPMKIKFALISAAAIFNGTFPFAGNDCAALTKRVLGALGL